MGKTFLLIKQEEKNVLACTGLLSNIVAMALEEKNNAAFSEN